MAVAAEAGREMPMARLPVPEMTTQMMSVPVSVAGEMVVVMIVVTVVMAEMVESMAEKTVAGETMTTATAAALGRSVDLSQRDRQEGGRRKGCKLSQHHRLLCQ
jgi:hypothetical protein